MIRMFMRCEHRVHTGKTAVNMIHALGKFFSTQTSINQDTFFACFDVN